MPEREKQPYRRGFIAAALLSVSVIAALAWAGANSASAVSWGIGPDVIHDETAVEIWGTKDPATALSVEISPPGNAWSSVDGYCSGLEVGSSEWSCWVPGERHNGNHQVRLTDSNGAVETGQFVVVADAAHAEQAPPPPPPPPPVPTQTPTQTPKPTPTPTPTAKTPEKPRQLDTLAFPVDEQPTPTPTETAAPKPPSEAVVAEEAPRTLASSDEPQGVPRSDPAAPGFLSGTIPTWQRLLSQPLAFVAAGGLGGLILLLVAIPANILDSTIEANATRLSAPFARFAPFFGRVREIWAKIPRFKLSAPLMIVLATFAFGLADPDFGVDPTSLRTTIALALGLLLVVMLPIAITRVALGRRWHVPAEVIARPGALILAVAGVLASRTFGFYPGLLIGLVVGLELASEARSADRARAITVRMACTLGIATLAWIGYSWLSATTAGADPSFFAQLLGDTLVATTVEGLTGVMVALLPVTFLDGKDLFDGSRRTWLAFFLPTAFAFSLIVLPIVVNDGGPEAPLGLWIAVLIAFATFVGAVWLTLRLLDRRDAAREKEKTAALVDAE